MPAVQPSERNVSVRGPESPPMEETSTDDNVHDGEDQTTRATDRVRLTSRPGPIGGRWSSVFNIGDHVVRDERKNRRQNQNGFSDSLLCMTLATRRRGCIVHTYIYI